MGRSMSDILHQVLTRLGAVDEGLKNIQKRNDEDRKDAGRHREWQRSQNNEMREEIRSIGDRVSHIEPIYEDLHRQGQRKKFAREWLVRFGRSVPYVLSIFTAGLFHWLGIFKRFGEVIA